ncbi:c-type cytochrome [Sulfurimonas aquatica]|uniref:C-type cytochrome n=1 Tax=Sulfurimonas aquatica TaxID=2672570 RepID=A0A975B0Y2_9BACT|nr:c-type cytochrome [Sulfurimonas aquatica]QSZ42118.1 c-type cytochrome [Sulfurimonas aquatica]
MKLVLSVVISIFILGCSEEKSTSLEKEVVNTSTQISKVLNEKPKELIEQTKEVTKDVVENISEKVKENLDEVTKETTLKVIEKAPEKLKKPAVEVEKVQVEVVKEEIRIVNKSTVDGSKLFSKCTSCHGLNAQKKALGKSQVIQGWSSEKLKLAINGYKDGSYGGAMKGVMKSYASALNEEEVEAISKYISELK